MTTAVTEKPLEDWCNGLDHFLDCIDFGKSCLDAEAIAWWNENLHKKGILKLFEKMKHS